MAYEAGTQAMYDVYVRPFPNLTDGRWRVSTNGGTEPVWSHDGRFLFYRSGAAGEAMMRVPVRPTPEFSFERPERLFEGAYVALLQGQLIYNYRGRMYELAPDDRRFLMLKAVQPADALTDQVVLVQNWTEELKRLVPVD